jgi:hypothetical protein
MGITGGLTGVDGGRVVVMEDMDMDMDEEEAIVGMVALVVVHGAAVEEAVMVERLVVMEVVVAVEVEVEEEVVAVMEDNNLLSPLMLVNVILIS